MRFSDHFTDGLHPRWRVTQIGRGLVQVADGQLHLTVPPTPKTHYSDAQISTYSGRTFHHRPPLRLTVRARFSPPPQSTASHGAAEWVGTAGFGFWNQPFMPNQRGFALPQAVWFFFSAPPNNMALAKGLPGFGWKAATFNARRWAFLALLPTAPLAMPLMRIPPLYNALWPIGQRAIGVSEKLLDPALLAAPHTYTLDWLPDRAIFAVDGAQVHIAPVRITHPLGLVLWVDNQYAIITPQGHIGFGLSEVRAAQTLIIESITLEQPSA